MARAERAPRTTSQVLLTVLPFLLMGVVAAVDLLAGPGIGFLPMLSLGPALAAVSLRPMQTVLVGGLAMALCETLATYDNTVSHRRGFIALATIAGVTVAGLIASAGRQRRERELANVRAVADIAQRVLLHPVPEQVGRLQLAVEYISAAVAARIGGDLYEVITTNGKVRLIVADVQGKGLPAVQTAAVVLGAFREAAYEASGLVGIAGRIEASLQRQGSEDEFVTAVLAQVGTDGSTVEILNCGHPPPVLVTSEALAFAEPPEVGLPLGLERVAAWPRVTHLIPLRPGDSLLFYTDGISDARDKAGVYYPLDRAHAVLAGVDPAGALERLCLDVVRHVGHPLPDDAAMLLMSRSQEAPAPIGGHAAANGQAAQSPARDRRPIAR